MPRFQVESWYMPDTTLHPLNGEFVVQITDTAPREVPWLSPDEADTFASALHEAAELARMGLETEDTEGTD